MHSFAETLNNFIIPCTLSIICTMISFGFIYKNSLRYIRKRVGATRFLFGDFLLVLLFVLPQFVVGYFLDYSNPLGPVFDMLLIYPSPIFVFITYYIYRKLYQVPAAYIFSILEIVMLGQYICMLVFKLSSDIWGAVLLPEYAWPELFDADLAAMLTTILIAFVVMLVLRYIIVVRNHYLEIPYGYPEPNVRRELLYIFLVITICYLVLVGFSMLIFQPRLNEISINNLLLYGVLIAIISLFAAEARHRRAMAIKTWQQQATEAYVESVLAATNNVRGLRHDYANIIQVYNGYITSGDFEGLRRYNDTVTHNLRQAQGDIVLLNALRPRTAVYTLLNAKLQLARDLDISYSIMDIASLVDVKMDDFDFCRILGCTLDNAIEAASETDEKIIRIQMNRPNRLSLTLSITNSTKGAVNIDQLFEPGFTTREGHEGQGMPSVKKIMEGYRNCHISVNYYDHLFTISLELPLL